MKTVLQQIFRERPIANELGQINAYSTLTTDEPLLDGRSECLIIVMPLHNAHTDQRRSP